MTGHSDLYVQLHKAGVPTALAETAANVQNHVGVPPGLLDILAAVVAAVNARCERLEVRLAAFEADRGSK
jgi:hypothetical protein